MSQRGRSRVETAGIGALPASGGRHRTRMTAYFIFDEQERLVCERIYFDALPMLKQLLGSVELKKPRN